MAQNIFCMAQNIFRVAQNIFRVARNIFRVARNIFQITGKAGASGGGERHAGAGYLTFSEIFCI
jgi:hypothetical protein